MTIVTTPSVGMKFDSVIEAWKFWAAYGKEKGFGVRKRYLNKRKDGSIRSCRFVCCKEGHRTKNPKSLLVKNPKAETRTDCDARIALGKKDGKFVIHEFIEAHNHPLQLPETTHMLASHRKISEVQAYEIEMAEDSGLKQKASFQLMSAHVGGGANLGYTQLDAKNYLKERRKHARMILDYGYFGDVVSLDTTYCTSGANRPLALFSGFNHLSGTIIFGSALLYDETAESFKWLFETFLHAHGNKKMAKALAEVMSETRHGLCTWHLMQNGIKNLAPKLLKRGNHFMYGFAKCMYEYDQEVKFETSWSKLVAEFDVFEDNWVKSMYALKEKWATCYMKEVITLGMRSTQLSESLNSNFKAYMKPDINIIQFFNHFESVVEEKRYNELVSEYESRHKLPKLRYKYSSILMQLAQIYTPTVFEMFHDEFSLFFATCIRERNVSQFPFEYVITSINDEGEWRVLFDPVQISISCNCRKFETFGILCCHALKEFEANDVKFVSEKYILKRWTKDARSGIIHDIHANEVVENPKLSIAQRYRQLCSIMIKFAADVSSSESLSQLAIEGLQNLYKKVMFQYQQHHMFQKQAGSSNDLG